MKEENHVTTTITFDHFGVTHTYEIESRGSQFWALIDDEGWDEVHCSSMSFVVSECWRHFTEVICA